MDLIRINHPTPDFRVVHPNTLTYGVAYRARHLRWVVKQIINRFAEIAVEIVD